MNLHYQIVETAGGCVGLVGSQRGLRRLYLPHNSSATLTQTIHTDYPAATEDPAMLPKLAHDLQRYFEGHRVRFNVRLDMGDATPFVAAVWDACRKIPPGRTMTYGELARRVGRPGAARAVGMAMAHNRFPLIVPCHRVLRSDGGLGGFSGPGGVSMKQQLLAIEAGVAH